jgi:hypothetical protein
MKTFPNNKTLKTHRSGVTLVEVLMSLLVMSIGVLSVATMFPISVLRALQATNLTHATVLRYNAQAALEMFPSMLDNIPVNTGGVSQGITTAIVDPLGFHLIADMESTSQTVFGNVNRDATVDGHLGEILRTGFGGLSFADSLVTLQDTWVLQVDGVASAQTVNTVTLLEGSLANISTGSLASRVVMFNANAPTKNSQTRTISSINTSTKVITFDSSEPNLPAGFTAGRIRVETQERRYTWMLTVRKRAAGIGKTTSSVDVVTFFRRPFSVDIGGDNDEQVFNATFTSGSDQVAITGDPPFMKKGGYVFDTQNAYWYRIRDISGASSGNPVITIDRLAQASVNDNPSAVFMRGVVDVFPIGTFIRTTD